MSGKRKASTLKDVKREDDETTTAAIKTEEESASDKELIQVSTADLIEAGHNRCSLKLVEAVVCWSQLSHHIELGEMVKIIDPKHMYYNGTGYIVEVKNNGRYGIYFELSEHKTFLLPMKRSQIIGCLYNKQDLSWMKRRRQSTEPFVR